ncbi:Isobutyryl-CoA dehydrogenase, mitochondrial [Mortierella hygrophila]|uniref:Isobutyryl-CoA dehydrogenase, mitochondrial n=1 Tax=Mortierella hygrophila TaxID=979708 RepID=A0A9P6F614_9FUNG|nr:Isobutyryl-CoA dehydrogenase, mitochondrial [Mortierella hygrophila]
MKAPLIAVSSQARLSTLPIDPSIGLTDRQMEIQSLARAFADKEFAPKMQEWDKKGHFPLDVMRKSVGLGYGGLFVREDVGGAGLGRTETSLVFEALSTGDVSTTAYMTLHNMCGGIIDTFGTEEQRQKYLPRLTSMELFSSYCLTEPGAGSDAANLSTKAVKKGSHYVLNGSKAFISGAGASEVYLILARTSGKGPKGVSCFIVEKGFKGLSFGKKESKVGWNSQPTRAVIMEDCEVPVENLVGLEGQGFHIAMSGLNGSRLNIGAAQASLEATLEYVKDRKRSGDSSAGFQTDFKLADLATSLVSSRLMIREAAAALDRSDSNASLYSSMAKLNASERCFSIIDECFQLLGGCGYLEDHKLNVYLRDARVHRILGGTSEIMRMMLARSLLH